MLLLSVDISFGDAHIFMKNYLKPNIMKKTFLALVMMALASMPIKAQFLDNVYSYIEDLAVFEKGQEEPHAYYLADNHVSLNGTWKFFFGNTPEDIPANFYKTNFSDGKWSKIAVPCNWEMQGFGDPIFRNVAAPFKSNVPFVPRDYNPTGAYRRTFNVPANWKGQQVFLRLEKAQSASFVWINGEEVGYNEGGQEPAEYDVTKYLKSGKNTIAVWVSKYSDGYYLEGQDYWRLAGIFDDVTLYATPKTRLFDWYVTTDLDDQYRDAKLNIAVDVKNYEGAADAAYSVRATLTDAKGAKVKEMVSDKIQFNGIGKKSVNLSSLISNPDKWTAETPTLYNLNIELLDEQGKTVQQIPSRMGFKETEIRGNVFYLNGQPIKVNATNTHMQHPELGHAMTEDVIRKDMEILKQHNFNAVRTSHYPPVNKYLELADEYGLYIIDEAGVEAHATEFVSSDERFLPMYLERVRQLVYRDRNHACVLFWSAGNESGEGPNITEVVKEGKRLDPTRYFMYGGNAYSHPGEEIIGPRYPAPFELETNTAIVPVEKDPRPSFMDEYLSVAGNACGALDEYWEIIRKHPRIMGGAIWDFVSPGLTDHIRPVKDSSPYNTPAHLMGFSKVQKGVLKLSGHEEWVEVYRQNQLELKGQALTISFDVKPGKLCGANEGAPYITKGVAQFGVRQMGEETLRFYLHAGKQYNLDAKLPENWKNNWHHVTASWDGKEMKLIIDGVELARAETLPDPKAILKNVVMDNYPYSINIGRIEASHGSESHTIYTADAEMDNVAIYDKCLADGEGKPEDALLYLTFDSVGDEGTFYTYGVSTRSYGSIWPDRTVQPEMLQMKWTTQPISFRLIDPETGLAEVTNRNYFTDLSKYDFRWTLQADGDVVESGTLNVNVNAQQKKIVSIPYHKPQIVAGKEYRVTISAILKNDEVWAKAGHEVAWNQLELDTWNIPAPKSPVLSSKVKAEQDDKQIRISGEGFAYVISKTTGNLEQVEVGGKQVLSEPLSFNLWRAPLANESDNWNSYRVSGANAEGFGAQVATLFYAKGLNDVKVSPTYINLEQTDRETIVTVRQIALVGSSSIGNLDAYIRGIIKTGYTIDYTYRFGDDGTVEIKNHMSPHTRLPELLPRIGFTTMISKDFDNITWYGRGPEENYPDRKTGYPVGVWSKTVAEMYEPYIMPQDHALRTDTRYVQLKDKNGNGVQISMNELFNFNAYQFTTDNLTKSMYTYQLQPLEDSYTLNLDYATTGVGCTAVYVLEEYRTKPVAYDRVITIKPVK